MQAGRRKPLLSLLYSRCTQIYANARGRCIACSELTFYLIIDGKWLIGILMHRGNVTKGRYKMFVGKTRTH